MTKKIQLPWPPLHRLPFGVKLFWAKCFIRMFRGFGKTYYDDIILFNELNLWIETKGKPVTNLSQPYDKEGTAAMATSAKAV